MQSTKPAVRAAAAEKLAAYSSDERVISAMMTACTDANPAVRKYAAITLGDAKDPRGIEPLCALLKDGNENIRNAAIDALQSIGDARALPSLFALLQQGHTADSYVIIDAIGSIGGENAVQGLLALARDPKSEYRRGVIRQLGYLHEARLTDIILPELQAVTDQDLSAQIEAAGRIGDPRFVAPLLALLTNPTAAGNRDGVISALGELGDARAVDALCQVLRDSTIHNWDRGHAAEALGNIGDPRAIPALTAALAAKGENTHELRMSVIWALGNMHDPTVVDALLPFLKEKDETLRLVVLSALGNTRAPHAYEGLAAELHDTENPLYSPALYALAQIPDPRAVPRVITGLKAVERLSMSGWSLRDLARALLDNPTATPETLLPALDIHWFKDSWNEIAQHLLRTHDPNALHAVLESLANDFRFVDSSTLQALQARQQDVFPHLCTMLAARGEMEKRPVIRLLGQLGDARAIPVLQSLKDDFWTRAEVLQALGALKAASALPKLLAAAKQTQDEQTCAAAVRGLGVMGEQSARDTVWAVTQLKPTAFNEEARLAALVAAAQLGDPRALEPALALWRSDDSEQRKIALSALGSFPEHPRIAEALAAGIRHQRYSPYESPAPLIAALTRQYTPALGRELIRQLNNCDYQSDVANEARLCITVLAERKEAQAVPALIRNLYIQQSDTIARRMAVQALGQLGDQRAFLPCLHALKDASPEVVTAAAAALNTLTGEHFGADHARWGEWWLRQQAR